MILDLGAFTTAEGSESTPRTNLSLPLSVSLLPSLSLSLPGFLTAAGSADGERDAHVGALSGAPADPGRDVRSG